MAVSSRRRSCGERVVGSSDVGRMGVASVLTHADVRSAPGRSSGEDVDDRRQLVAAAYLICTRKRFELSPGCERNPALTDSGCQPRVAESLRGPAKGQPLRSTPHSNHRITPFVTRAPAIRGTCAISEQSRSQTSGSNPSGAQLACKAACGWRCQNDDLRILRTENTCRTP